MFSALCITMRLSTTLTVLLLLDVSCMFVHNGIEATADIRSATRPDSIKSGPSWLRSFVSKSPLIKFGNTAVSADNPHCSRLGARVLNKLKGNAIDAAVATMLCVGATNFHSAGIGGGSFLVYYDRRGGGLSHSMDYRERASRRATADMYKSPRSKNSSLFGGLAIAVPGEIAGLSAVHRRFGRLPWRLLAQPVVGMLYYGRKVSKPLAKAMAGAWPFVANVDTSSPHFELRRWLLNPKTGRVYVEGDVLRDRRLSATYQRIADNPASFYSGRLARIIVSELNAVGSIIDLEDLRRYRPVARQTVSVAMRHSGLTAHVMPPPSSGLPLAFALRILDGFRFTRSAATSSLKSFVTFLHRTIEATKFAFALRSWLGDPDFVDVADAVRNLTSEAFAEYTRSKIDDARTREVEYYGPSFHMPEDSGTSHVSIRDSDGNAVAVTATINTYFGSLIRGAKTGIFYNNEMADFNLAPSTSPYNQIAPGKRPMSSMSPIVLTDSVNGAVRFVAGAAGGRKIIGALVNVLARQIWLNETVKEAVDSCRFTHQLTPNAIQINRNTCPVLSESLLASLRSRGHKIIDSHELTVVEVIQERGSGDSLELFACSDFRKPSRPCGE